MHSLMRMKNNVRMQIIIFLILLFLNVMYCSGQVKKRTVYISSSVGNDKNDGSKTHPLKTITNLLKLQKSNMTIYLKRGDVFYESISGLYNCKIIPYGRGENPVICGFRVIKDAGIWEQVDNKIWKLDLSNEKAFLGYSNNMLAKYKFNNIGSIYVPSQDKIYGHLVRDKSLLIKNGDFYTTDKCQDDEIKKEGIHYLFFYSDTPPKEYKNLCISVGGHGISSLTNCYLSNLSVIGFGVHGICQLNHCVVKNCRVDIIGGSIQFGKCPWVRYGNGIEFWISNNDTGYTNITGCVVSRTYDCGSTIQGSSEKLARAVNIVFEKNQFVYCRQAFEHFMQCDDFTEKYVNCSFRDNISYMAGENQFDSPEIRDADVLSYELQNRTMSITNNVFYGGNYYFGNRNPDGMNNNTVFVFEDQYIHNPHSRKELSILNANNDSLGLNYRGRTGDNSRIIVLKRNSNQDMKIRKRLLKKLRYKKTDLKLD